MSQIPEEHVDAGFASASDPVSIDRIVQNIWGLRYIDDLVLRRVDANYPGSGLPDFSQTAAGDIDWEQYLTDHQFSVVAAVGRTGTLAFRVAYDAYGEARHLPAKDINGDGKVDRTDTTLAQNASGKRLGQLGYNPDADWDRDGKITSADVAQFGSRSYVAALPQGQLAQPGSATQPLAGDVSPGANLARAANARSDFNIGFSGYRFNGDIGAYTVRFRHYDPTPGMCRWLERDPAGYQDGPSLYSYLGRNPMAGTDPYGLALYSVSGDSRAGRAIKRRLAEIDRNKAMARGINGSMCRHPLGSDAQFNDDMRINPDRLEDLGKVGQGIGTAIETTASVLPGGGFATAVNEASQGNFGEAALNVVPGEKVAGLFVSLFLSKAVLVTFASGERVAREAAEASSKLNKSLASHAQLGEVGTTMAGAGARVPFRGAERIAEEYGGNAADWVKKSSSSYTAPDGTVFETHWVENIRTGERIEFKTKLPRGL